MKNSLFCLTLFLTTHAFASGISGKVTTMEGCAKKVMVWLSLDKEVAQERLLLMHTEVPVGGSYKFYTKPGKYQIRGSDESGCEFFGQVEVSTKEEEVTVRMVRK